jgi:RNA polymerase sigma-70 factor (ECF subfamily)
VTDSTKAKHFQDVVLPHLHAAYNLARWLSRSDHDAQDIVQEAYLRAFRFFDGFHGGDARAWLLAIVRNATYTWLKQNRPHELATPFDEEFHSLPEDGAVEGPERPDNNPETILARRDDKRLLDEALENLPLAFREVLVLRELEDLSYKEIARIADIPIGTVMSRLARGRKLLGECLKQQEAFDEL